jgi:hypothetical protein
MAALAIVVSGLVTDWLFWPTPVDPTHVQASVPAPSGFTSSIRIEFAGAKAGYSSFSARNAPQLDPRNGAPGLRVFFTVPEHDANYGLRLVSVKGRLSLPDGSTRVFESNFGDDGNYENYWYALDKNLRNYSLDVT